MFCGCGSVTAALRTHNVRVLAAIDNDPVACATYRANHPKVNLYERDVRNLDPKIVKTALPSQRLDLLIVCAPCQPFSSHRFEYENDPRANLILEAVRWTTVLRPKVIFFENVPGLAADVHRDVLASLQRRLQRIRYRLLGPFPVDAADYGVPQHRRRCIMLAVRGRHRPRLEVPAPTGRKLTVRSAIGRLMRLQAAESHPSDPLHFARSHRDIVLHRMGWIPKDGGSRDSLPPRLQLACHRGHSGHQDVYGRLAWDAPAPTLTTGCTDVTKGRFAHPEDDRAITLREAARLQTFPDDYTFRGSATQIAVQIGNAMPIRLVEAWLPLLRTAVRG